MRGRRRPGSVIWIAAAPALLVTAPLSGIAFQNDERRSAYRHAARGRDNLIDALDYGFSSVDTFMDAGNFRPLGRFVQSLSGGFAIETAEATGLAPHAVNGVGRLLSVLLLAVVATRVAAALSGSSGQRSELVVIVYPLVLGTTLVANGRGGPLVYFPGVFVVTTAAVLAVCLAVARETDMCRRRLRATELPAMVLLGASAAMFHDLAYVAPPLAAVFIVARASATGLPWRSVVRSAASGRWAALTTGFLLVFVPVRLVIAARCGQSQCYAPSDLSFSGDVAGLVATRLTSGSPLAGWSLISDLAGRYGLEFGFGDLLANAFGALLMAAVVAVTVTAAVRADACAGHRTAAAAPSATGTITSESGASREPPDPAAPAGVSRQQWRTGIALGLFGVATAGLPALLVSLSRWLQQSRIDHGWRDTVLVQVGWSFAISSALLLLLAAVSRHVGRNARRIGAIGAAVLLGAGVSCTLLTNSRLAQIDRRTPESAITAQIATATISFDSTDRGNALRCALIDAYAQQVPEHLWVGAPGVLEDLDELMLDRHGLPFCDPDQPREHPGNPEN
ncbi:MAG: hypothetical protein OXC00_09295 [Acidimicrobiaceae bacterium]|nr:hypothetical protein [Acidimicrobiaceae bacterium]